jgi:hypothetical protein
MPDPSLWRPYAPTPAPRLFLLYVAHLGPTGKLVPQGGRMWGETLDIKDILLPFMTILRAGPDW